MGESSNSPLARSRASEVDIHIGMSGVSREGKKVISGHFQVNHANSMY